MEDLFEKMENYIKVLKLAISSGNCDTIDFTCLKLHQCVEKFQSESDSIRKKKAYKNVETD